ncbi:energy-coupling factor ABC transporter permease [Geobacter sp. AOG2]|uniref:energy-coupling factor ABC transporter permease n=1 Tax=Geobacter sp. AOG2 TaxID=1566347 RepID=UPI001CC646BB|nr:energy-coupling factor ABC transporter permease [Geobacter sp. AOG2]GFE60891.1 cobalamin biosynthesis protein CbiM [Geobacter sp. AOG2]
MHMADALLSPAVGGTMWAVSAGSIAYCSAKVRKELDDRKVPLMGVLGAFLFAAQMINFTIPATGSSGHLGGGLLLAILLGPYAAFLTISSVLMVQALFFADGGLLALGCNIFNMGFIPAFLVYPLVYKKISGPAPGRRRLIAATMISAIIGLQLGPLGVVLETAFSGISALPFSTFALLMQPIHLAIGVVEGAATVAIISFVHKARPEIIQEALGVRPVTQRPLRTVLVSFVVAALLTGGILSWFASKNPDGLEWAIAKVTGAEELKGPEEGLHAAMTSFQKKTAFLPDYSFKSATVRTKSNTADNLGTSVSGFVGGLMTLVIVFLSGFLLKRRIWSA